MDLPEQYSVESLPAAAAVLDTQAVLRRTAKELSASRIPVLLLKGPDLQMRLYGTPIAYRSGDVDILVPRGDAKRARDLLVKKGWTFDPGNGVLWRLSAAATFLKKDVSLDLHWGLHAAHLPARTLRPLENTLWEGARSGPSGLLEPDDESLLVYLAVHAVGHGFERPQWAENVRRAAEHVTDWGRVHEIARRARVTRAVEIALDPPPETHTGPLLDGRMGSVYSAGSWLLRGHFLPGRARGAVRRARERVHRHG